MTPVNTSPIASAMAGQSAASQALVSEKTTLNSDFQTFLEMLTAQAQNQDPLNPMDSAEYASQLASFSSVEQQVKTNELLSALATQFSASNLSQLSSWVGMDVRSAAPVAFDGAPETLHPLPASLADQAEIVVYDAAGSEVQRISIGASDTPLEWAGVDETGAPFPTGLYRFEIENFANGEFLGTSPVETYQRVEEAQMLDGQVVLLLEGGMPLAPHEVIGLRGG